MPVAPELINSLAFNSASVSRSPPVARIQWRDTPNQLTAVPDNAVAGKWPALAPGNWILRPAVG